MTNSASSTVTPTRTTAGPALFVVPVAVVAITLPEEIHRWNSISQTANEKNVTSVGYTTAACPSRRSTCKRLRIRWMTTVSKTPATMQNSQDGKYEPSTLMDGGYAHPDTRTAASTAIPTARFGQLPLMNGTCRFKVVSMGVFLEKRIAFLKVVARSPLNAKSAGVAIRHTNADRQNPALHE